MNRPLGRIKVVEVAMWAFVPSAGAVLSDLGAEVVKIETTPAIRCVASASGGITPGTKGFSFMWEIFNRGKRSVGIDLGVRGATDTTAQEAPSGRRCLPHQPAAAGAAQAEDRRRRHHRVDTRN